MVKRSLSRAAFVAGRKRVYRKPKLPKRISSKKFKPMAEDIGKMIGTQATPARVERFINVVIDKAVRGKSSTAAAILKRLAKPISVKVSDGIMKVGKPPITGIASPSNVEVPVLENNSIRRVSGYNNLYNAKEHKVNFTVGGPPGKWLRSCKINNGEISRLLNDSSVDYPLDHTNRGLFTKFVGFNQKLVYAVDTNFFGFEPSQLESYVGQTTFDSSLSKEQKAYAAISKLSSYMTITSLNKYVPVYVKLYLCRHKVPSDTWTDLITSTVSNSLVTQGDGLMPIYLQQTLPASDILGSYAYVDPKSKGIRSADTFNLNAEIISTKKIKLPAGDRIKVSYDHLCPSGVRVDKIHGINRDVDYRSDSAITYCMFMEIWGEEVDAYSLALDSSGKVMKGTSTSVIQFEFSKKMYGSVPATIPLRAQNLGADEGYDTTQFLIKVYSDMLTQNTTRRYFSPYSSLGVDYEIPIMSDSTSESAGRIL